MPGVAFSSKDAYYKTIIPKTIIIIITAVVVIIIIVIIIIIITIIMRMITLIIVIIIIVFIIPRLVNHCNLQLMILSRDTEDFHKCFFSVGFASFMESISRVNFVYHSEGVSTTA